MISTILSSLSLAAYILVLVFNLCLKNIKQEGGSDGAAVAVPQGNNIPVVAQSVLFNNPYNIMFNQNMVSPPGTYGYAPGYGAPPGSNGALILNLGIKKFMNWIKTIYYFNLKL